MKPFFVGLLRGVLAGLPVFVIVVAWRDARCGGLVDAADVVDLRFWTR